MPDIGSTCYNLIQELYPICRSITGNGVRQTLGIISRQIPLEIKEVPSGTQVFDWTVPREWNIRDAYIKDSKGERIVDFKKSNLHVVNYSVPIHEKLPLSILKDHLHTIPKNPDWIPYKTSYYKEDWGFCLAHKQFLALQEGEYEVCIDSSLEPGSLTYGELLIPGREENEILITTHICHPSLCNDNLSSISIASSLARAISATRNRYSYRFLFIPGTIGAITWLALNKNKVDRIKHGLVLSGLGDSGPLRYKKSRQETAEIDQVAAYILMNLDKNSEVDPFHPYGYDERQFCSPGFNLPVGRLSRKPYGQYPEYHTSADNLNFVSSDQLEQSYECILSILNILEHNHYYKNLCPFCEPQLGRRGLYESIGDYALAMLWILNLSDGQHSLFEIALQSGVSFDNLPPVAKLLEEKNLLEKIPGEL